MFTVEDRQTVAKIAGNWRLTPATLAHKLSNGSWIPAKHLKFISLKIAQAIAKGGGRIIISLPPRHGKSELASVWTPVWTLENFPRKQVILASYGADLSVGFGRRVRDSFLDLEFQTQLRTRLNPKSQKVSMFHTTEGGYMASVGVGGPITGRGAHVLLIDDYIKEVKEALSPTYREYIWNWFVTTAFTRLEPGGTCIIIATRWHTDDLIGRVMANLPGWEYIEIPAISERDDPIQRAPGLPLFEERYPMSALLERKLVLGSVWFEALYQQKPMDETKKVANSQWLCFEKTLPDVGLRTVRVWDLAATEGGGDYTTGTRMGLKRDDMHVYITDVRRGQLSSSKAEILVRKTAEEDGRNVMIGIEQEPGSSGKSLVEHYKNNVLRGFLVKAIPATTKKLIRAQPFLAAAEARQVHILNGDWNEQYKREMDSFPGGLNDDQMDTSAAAYTLLTGRKVFSTTFGRRTKGASKGDTVSSKAIRRKQLEIARPMSGDKFGKVIPAGAHTTKFGGGITFGRRRTNG